MTSASVTPVHLWAEEHSVRWWTPGATGLVNTALPPAGQAATRLEPGQRALRECLPAPLAEVLLKTLPAQLVLAENLPAAWTTLPWETLLMDGRPLLGRLGVVRYAPWPTLPEPVCPGDIGLLDLLPRHEQWFRGHPALANRIGAILHLERGDLSDLGVLVIATHGRRQGDIDMPFRDHDGQPWGLPLERHFPPVVLLLACGDDRGDLLHYARRLLTRGARAVLAPRGELNGEQAAAFLEAFRQHWASGTPLAAILLQMQADPGQYHSAARLQLLGHGDCAARVTTPDLATQLTDITLHNYRRPGGWDLAGALDAFRKQQGLPEASFGDTGTVMELRDGIQQVEADLPLLTRRWVLSLLAYLAEICNDHQLLSYLQRQRPQIMDPRHAEPLDHYHWHKLHYRRGQYPAAFLELATGIALSRGRDSEIYTRLLGGLCNLFIDFHLAEPARKICIALEDALYGQSMEAEEQRFKLYDRQARAALRRGALVAATVHYHGKRDDAVTVRREDGLREDIGLLQTLSWHDPRGAEARDLAQWLLAIFQAQADAAGYRDNADHAYLCQSLALWAWRATDGPTHDAIHRWVLHDPRPLAGRDTGPLGMTTVYLMLGSQKISGEPTPLETRWESIRHAMAQQGYWLELAALYCFLGDHDNCREALGRFQQRRRPVLERGGESLAEWLEEGVPGVSHWQDWLEILESRERDVFKALATPEEVARQGLMPL